jgi:peptide/nickel transport system permease protein
MGLKKNKKSNDNSDVTEILKENAGTIGLSQGQIIRRRFFQHKPAVAGLIFMILFTLFVYSASGIHLGTEDFPISIQGWWPYTITTVADFSSCGSGCPSWEHPMGMDTIGRDYFALVVRGAEISLMVMVVIGSLGGIIGTCIGAVSGYFGGMVDAVLMRVTDFVITIPAILIGAVVGYQAGNLGVLPLAIFLGIFAWTGLARLVRGEFLSLREREFVDAARVSGASNRRIIFRHILPNAVGVIIVSVTLLLSSSILIETSLSFIGFGVTDPDVSLGLLINKYQDSFTFAPWLFWWPGVIIIAIALSINFIGDGLRDAFDPRQRRKIKKREFLLKSPAGSRTKK